MALATVIFENAQTTEMQRTVSIQTSAPGSAHLLSSQSWHSHCSSQTSSTREEWWSAHAPAKASALVLAGPPFSPQIIRHVGYFPGLRQPAVKSVVRAAVCTQSTHRANVQANQLVNAFAIAHWDAQQAARPLPWR